MSNIGNNAAVSIQGYLYM